MARSRRSVVLRCPAIEDLLAIPEFRRRAVGAILYILETSNGKDAKEVSGRSEQNEQVAERHDDLWTQGEIAKGELADYRKKSATDLIGGADGEAIASELAKRDAKVGMYAGALAELDGQLTAQQSVADDAERAWSAELNAEAARKVRAAAVKMIKTMATMQVELYKAAKLQLTTGRVIVDFDAAATDLEKAQAVLETDAKIRERSKTPNAARIGGW